MQALSINGLVTRWGNKAYQTVVLEPEPYVKRLQFFIVKELQSYGSQLIISSFSKA